jgi:WD40 repeat protein
MTPEPHSDNLDTKEKRKNAPRRLALQFFLLGLIAGVLLTLGGVAIVQQAPSVTPDFPTPFASPTYVYQSMPFTRGDIRLIDNNLFMVLHDGANADVREYALTTDTVPTITLVKREATLGSYLEDMVISPDGQYFLQDMGGNLQLVKRVAGEELQPSLYDFYDGAWNTPKGDKNLLILAKMPRIVEIWDTENTFALTAWNTDNDPNQLALNQDGTFWAISYLNSMLVSLYDVNTRAKVFEKEMDALVTDLQFLPNNELLTVTLFSVQIEDWQTGQTRWYAIPDSAGRKATVSADKSWLVVSTATNVYVWRMDDSNGIIEPNTDTTSPMQLFDYLGTSIVGLTFTSDNRYLIVAMGNGEVRVWDTTTWQLVATG